MTANISPDATDLASPTTKSRRLGDHVGTLAASADSILNAFLETMLGRGLELYPAQEQAILELMGEKHVILATPTGSGKSLVALAMQFRALIDGQRAFYTCPVKALVSEKFFALCNELGAENVGMLTGDASINRDAPIICCTAEILANLALREPPENAPEAVIMDEFHYYGDRDRGMAWQLPLLTLQHSRFLLMSATLGDTLAIEESLKERTGRETVVVKNSQRPVPLDFTYRETPVHETISDLVRTGKAPIYIVNFTQRECAEQAQNLLSVDFCSKDEKRTIAAAVGAFRFDSPFGKDVSRLVRHGVGIHHAGLLPKYRLLVEQLAQQGLLRTICGTDTLGVGVNVPIRTVLFTRLSKFDGEQSRVLSVRDFKQIAGRAGRKGFDDKGSVVCQAPEHVIENRRMEERASITGKKKSKLVKKKPPPHFVPWNDETFKQLIANAPEALESQFSVNHSMLLNLMQRSQGTSGYGALVNIIAHSHEPPRRQTLHRRRAALLFKSLRNAAILNVVVQPGGRRHVVMDQSLQHDFSLNHTLSLYLLETLPLLEGNSPDERGDDHYALNVLSLVEAILESPRVVLQKQVDVLKRDKLAELKAQGVEYDERIAELEKIEHPKPLREFIYETFNHFSETHPWIGSDNIRPKSIAREMYERCSSFNEYVKEYGLQRSEGVLLRYLSNAYKTLLQNVPNAAKDDNIFEVVVFLRLMLERVDSSLITEWEQMLQGDDAPGSLESSADSSARATVPLFDPKRDPRGFRARVRAELHQLVRALSQHNFEAAAECVRQPEDSPWPKERFAAELEAYFEEYGRLVFDHRARLPDKTLLRENADHTWSAQQILPDPEGHDQWVLEAVIDLSEINDADEPLLRLVKIGS